ncbi:efflux RND transporter periplasmic adaptor subunit [soil metagenome]
MATWKQIGLALALVSLAVIGWALFMPSAAPVLARLGLSQTASSGEDGQAAPRGGPGDGPGRGGPLAAIAIPVAEGRTNGRIEAIGDGRAVRSVAVTPLVSGRLVEIAVASGDWIEAGSVLAVLDEAAEAIQLSRAELALRDAEATLERVERLRGTGSATEVQLGEARLALDRAGLEVEDAELALERRRIRAPIGGAVGILPVEPGMQVSTSTEIATIDDRSRILVDFRVPERFVGAIAIGDSVAATALARPDLALDGRIAALDNRVDAETRTLRVQAAIENEDDHLRAGMAFRMAMSFEGERHPSVDPLAIQWSSEGAYVWAVREGRAERVAVRIVQRGTDQVLVAGEVRPGEAVVTEGMQRMRPGAEVELREESTPGGGAGLGISRADPSLSDT